MFDQFDTDGSGRMSRSEHSYWATVVLGDAYARPTWIRLDRDGSGAVTPDEFKAARSQSAADFDADQDGVITRAELMVRVPEGNRYANGGNGGSQRSGGRRGGGGESGGGRPPRG
jgi:Ca2+-binding EF-hand superfamily protein